jgi:glycosyltransferase involved in cell wall biosynthesis
MKIGMILDHIFPPDDRVEKEAISLIEAGHDVHILCFGSGKSVTSDTSYKGINIIRIQVSMKVMKKLRALTNTILNIYPYFWKFHINRFIEQYHIQVLHVHDLYMFPAAFLAVDKLPSKIPVVGDLHENYADALESYRFSTTFPGNLLINIKKWRNAEKELIGKLDYVITVVEEMKKRISPFAKKKENIIVVENAVDVDQFIHYYQDTGILNRFRNSFVISYIGGFDYHRGIDTIIEALAFLKDLKDIKLVLVGREKNSDRIHKLIDKLDVRKFVSFEGFIPQGILQNYFHLSKIGIIPHLKSVQTDNSHPNKLSQYMSMGVPIITSNCESIQRVIESTNAGLVYESQNAKDLAEKIRTLYNNADLRKVLSNNGKRAVFERYNWSYNAENLKRLYSSIEKHLL